MATGLFAGERVPASLLLSLIPNGVVKPSDESLPSSTAMQNDNDLVTNVQVSTDYIFLCWILYEGFTGGSGDIKWQWTLPAGASLAYQAFYENLTPTLAGAATFTAATVGQAQSNGAGNDRGIFMFGSLTVGVTAGNIQLQWAQNTSSATPTIVHTGSVLLLIPLPS